VWNPEGSLGLGTEDLRPHRQVKQSGSVGRVPQPLWELRFQGGQSQKAEPGQPAEAQSQQK
jgi:hypothetical protein